MEQITEIDINKIKLNPNNPRKEFDNQKLIELTNSIKEKGLINPIRVKKIEGGYELICGERRLKAHKLAGKKTIKGIIKEYNSKSEEMIDSLIENLHREDLSSIDKENFIKELWDTKKYKDYNELSRVLGLSPNHIRNILFSKKIRDKIKIKDVSTRDIRETIPLKNIEDKTRLLEKVKKGEVNSDKIRNISIIINRSPKDVKEAFFSDKISIKQADKISKISNEKMREKLISTHDEIKKIDRNIERKVKEIIPKSNLKVIKTKEIILNFRNNALETQKSIKKTIQSLINCSSYFNLMDTNQLNDFKDFQNLFETNLINSLEVSEKISEKTKEIKDKFL